MFYLYTICLFGIFFQNTEAEFKSDFFGKPWTLQIYKSLVYNPVSDFEIEFLPNGKVGGEIAKVFSDQNPNLKDLFHGFNLRWEMVSAQNIVMICSCMLKETKFEFIWNLKKTKKVGILEGEELIYCHLKMGSDIVKRNLLRQAHISLFCEPEMISEKLGEIDIIKDAELIELNKTIDSVEQMIQIWKSAPLTELEQVYSVLLQGAKLTDEKRNAQVKQFENQLKQNQEKRLQLMRMDNSITPKIAGNLSEKNRKENLDKDQEVKSGKAEVVDLGKGVKLEMVLIPAGKFMMGSPASENRRNKKETQHEVTLTKSYYLGKYEVTQEQWEAVMGNNPSFLKGAKLPVTNVSWEDCQEFIKKLNVKTDGGYRLPTNAEWEYACRAGTTTAYSFGDETTPQDANYKDSRIGEAAAVGSYKANAFGLYDMHGNVYEWCEDLYDYPFAVTDPKGPVTGEWRGVRGGSSSNGLSARSSNRSNRCGFRLVRTADSKGGVASPTETRPDRVETMPATGKLLVAPFSEAKAKEVQKAVAKSLQKEVEEVADLGKDVKLDLVLIPAGKFVMGSPDSEKGRDKKETQHEVTLTKPFYMGKYEVTQEQWEAVMGNNPSFLKGAKLPVTNVSWNDCQEFIKKLNVKTDGGYRLPTEAEWEYACRAGTTTAYSFGDEITPRDANYHYPMIRNPSPIEPSPDPVKVGSYKPNAFGLYDMHGNISEWCEDRFGDNPAGPVTDPRGPATGWGCVMRGGSTGHLESGVRSSFRNSGSPSDHFANYGFRLARTADSKGSVASPTETRPDPTGLTPSTRNEQFTFNKQDSSRQSTTEIKPPVKEPITPEDINEYYGVVAVSQNTGRYGFCFAHHKDKQEAANHALSFCNARDAKVVLYVKNQWFALASGGGGAFGWAYGSDPDEVREKALNECLRFSNRARIVVMEHSNNKKHTNHNLKSTSIKPSWDKSDVSKDDIKRDYEKILDFHNKGLALEVEKTIEELSFTRANVWKNVTEN